MKSLIERINVHTVHSSTEPMKNFCVMCRELYKIEEITFEQRLIADEDFCPRCWNAVVNTTYDNDLDNDFSKIIIPN